MKLLSDNPPEDNISNYLSLLKKASCGWCGTIGVKCEHAQSKCNDCGYIGCSDLFVHLGDGNSYPTRPHDEYSDEDVSYCKYGCRWYCAYCNTTFCSSIGMYVHSDSKLLICWDCKYARYCEAEPIGCRSRKMDEIEMEYEGVRISEHSIWEIERYCPDYTSYVTVAIVFIIGNSYSIGKKQTRYENAQCVNDDPVAHDLDCMCDDCLYAECLKNESNNANIVPLSV